MSWLLWTLILLFVAMIALQGFGDRGGPDDGDGGNYD